MRAPLFAAVVLEALDLKRRWNLQARQALRMLKGGMPMFGLKSRSRSHEISQRLEDLREDLTLLGAAIADAAAEGTRDQRRRAGRMAHDAMDDAGERVHRLADTSLSLAATGSREAMRHADQAISQVRAAATRHPTSTAMAVVGIGLAAVCVLNWMASRESAGAGRTAKSGRWGH